jgi:nitroreductase
MAYTKPITEIIPKRYSCRTYTAAHIENQVLEALRDYAAGKQSGPFRTRSRFEIIAASEEDNNTLKGLGTYGFIQDASGFIIGATRESGNSLEDFGYLMEEIILYATDLGLGTCWLGGTFTRSNFAEKISTQDDEIIPAVTSVGYPADNLRKIDLRIRKAAGSDHRLPWEELFFDTRFEVPLERQAAGEYIEPLEMVRLGPSASNKQPWRILRDGNHWHFYLHRTPGYRDNNYLKILKIADLQRVDMGIAMCHFELAARELGLNGGWEILQSKINLTQPQVGEDTQAEYLVSWVV